MGRTYKDTYIPTIEDFHRKIYKIRGEIFRLDILDMSGNDPFPAMKNLNIMIGDIFIVVFSLDDIDSFVKMKNTCEQIVEIKKLKHHTKINVPILIIGNKLDLLYENRIKSRCFNSVDFDKFISTLKNIYYHETSCKFTIGLEKAFEDIFYQSFLPIEMVPSKHRRISFNLDLTKPLFDNDFDLNKMPTINSIDDISPRSSFKQYARKSIRKMTFKKNSSEPCGTVWLNARRPSIRAELNLLQIKQSLKINLPKKNKNDQNNNNLLTSFLSLFLCKK